MVFSSLLFLFLFLPAVLAMHHIAPWRFKNLILFIMSLIFYAWGEPVYIILMLFSTLTDYLFGLLLDRPGASPTARRMIVAASILINLGVLGFFKYADFLIQNVNNLLGMQLPLTELPLPIGISFYTFQSMSYIIDVYRGQVKAQRNWIDFGTYIALFPQLVAGPIVQYGTIVEQLQKRTVTMTMFAEGVRRFTTGLAMKVLLANNIGLLWNTISTANIDELPVLTAWLGIIAFAFQIYFDFCGYSHMAIGLGLMLGFRFNENFNAPYTAQSITDFWRRWHISLGSWFKTYVYIPLGGNRRGLLLQIRNILIVWMLTGIWHGASWNFLLWGLYFGVILLLEKIGLLKLLQTLPRWARHVYALLLILIGWVLFAFDQLSEGLRYLGAMLGWNQQSLWNADTLYFGYTNIVLLMILVMACLPNRVKLGGRAAMLNPVWYGLLFILSIAYLVDATFNPFLYFRF